MPTITPFPWFDDRLEEAVTFDDVAALQKAHKGEQ
jgi:hypothetical protein